MKNIIIILSITFALSALHFAQIQQDRTIIRGNNTSITVKVPGNYEADSLIFQVRSNSSFTSTSYIAKKNDVAGGSTSEILAAYSYPYTTLTIYFTTANTSGLTIANYYYDVRKSVSPDSTILAYGIFTIQSYSGEVVTGITGGGSNSADFDTTYIYQALGSKLGIAALTDSLDAIRTLIGTGGSLPDSVLFASDSTDQRTFSDAKYASKSATQTFTGENTFSNNKTIFGTTTNDSVGVRGKLNVNGISSFGSLVNIGTYGTTSNRLIVNGNTTLQNNLTVTNLGKFDRTNNLVYIGDYLGVLSGTQMAFDLVGDSVFITSSRVILAGDVTGLSNTLNLTGTILLNGNPLTTGGSVSNADSLAGIAGTEYQLKTSLDNWTTNLSSGNGNELRLGKDYNTKRFNNGAYSDVWNIDYVIPPYNLSANWLYPIEHRTDYYNDTLNTVAHSDILNVDGTGTPIWRTNDVRIMGNEIAVNIGDLPDSTALDWSLAGLTGNKVILSEANKTAGATRFPMPVKGYEFKFGSTPYYTYPNVYGFYSDLTTNTPNLETAYHFYGKGNYPSYFGGNIQTDGNLIINDIGLGQVSIEATEGISGNVGIRTGETVQAEGDSPSFGFKIGTNISDLVPSSPMTGNWDWALPNKSGTVALTSDISDSLNAGYQSIYTGEQIDSLLALVGSGSVDSNVVNDLIENYLTDSSYASSYTGAQIDSLLALAGTALQPVDSNLYATQYDLSQVSGGSTRTKSAFDIVTPGINDSLMVFWLDDAITIDSMKVETTDSIAMQVGYDKGVDYEGPPLYLFSEGTLIISSSTFTTADFSTYSLAVDDKAYLYFTFVSSATTRLKIKIYWRYL